MLDQQLQKNLSDNLSLVRHAWIKALSTDNVAEFLDLHSESVVMHDPTLPQPLRGRAALRSWMENLFRMFPDYKMKEERIFGQDEWVCLEAEETGTLKGSIQGSGNHSVSPTNKSFKIASSIICRVSNNKIDEVRVYYDALSLMGQLGLGPG